MRKSIKEAIKADLQTIKIMNGYTFDVVKVFTGFKPIEEMQVDEFPAFGMTSLDTSIENSETSLYTWSLAIIPYASVYTSEDDDSLLAETLDEMFEAVVQLYSKDISNVIQEPIESIEIKGFSPDPLNEMNKGLGWIPIEIKYVGE